MVLFGPKRRLGKVEKEILESITGGDLLIGFLCSARSTRQMNKIAYERALARYRRRKSIASLVMKGFAVRNGEVLHITADGINALENAVQRVRTTLTQKGWDGKWRVVAYDIPEQYKKLRDQVRYILKRAGFVKLHHSIWVFPHDCNELTDLMKTDRRLRAYMLYGVFDSIQDDGKLRDFFKVHT